LPLKKPPVAGPPVSLCCLGPLLPDRLPRSPHVDPVQTKSA
jgi:hypothetical protein